MGNSVQYNREIKAGDTTTAVSYAYIRTMFGTVIRSIGVCILSTRMIHSPQVWHQELHGYQGWNSQLYGIICKHVYVSSDYEFCK